MSVRARAGRRSRPSLVARLRTFWLLAAFAIVAVGWSCWALATWPGFHLKALVVTGTSHVAQKDVVARAAIDPMANIWLLDRASIERRIEAIPYVAIARVHRRPIARVWIDVTERVPEACVRDGSGNVVTVDRDLRVLEADCAPGTALAYDVRGELATHPGTFLHDAELTRLQRDARSLAETGDRFRELRHDAQGALEATLHDGIAIRFGDDDDLAVKQRLIGPILAQLGRRTARVRAVDVRAPSTPVVEYR